MFPPITSVHIDQPALPTTAELKIVEISDKEQDSTGKGASSAESVPSMTEALLARKKSIRDKRN
jgi:hypothetical protein